MLVMIGSTDLTSKIENNSYVMEAEDSFLEWEDGNKQKHRVYVKSKVKGSFNVICDARLGMSSVEFLELIKENTQNNVLLITCWITNKAEYRTLNAYAKIITKKHTDTMDIFGVEVEER
ncbi:MAG: hypothetical protein E7299_04800 [Lachnospiraceae bacterium]|nr:hypothetical protein [Lachnospiraceae bacterium]